MKVWTSQGINMSLGAEKFLNAFFLHDLIVFSLYVYLSEADLVIIL